ncbi:hypothetical protein EYF80_010839 [Liparis tanakae]|uniref:Uncharacterized protein n=1 Tax=Liparis tanakae TaxID=230148 RepID=A0A4Z2IP14_9TELE|nr:hypothetical protein EYF80_010839 [Liparis tanakae]
MKSNIQGSYNDGEGEKEEGRGAAKDLSKWCSVRLRNIRRGATCRTPSRAEEYESAVPTTKSRIVSELIIKITCKRHKSTATAAAAALRGDDSLRLFTRTKRTDAENRPSEGTRGNREAPLRRDSVGLLESYWPNFQGTWLKDVMLDKEESKNPIRMWWYYALVF